MTEYWVSKKQYWCKYCNIWIRDDAPSRKQHETGLKHQGSKERYIRDLYKTGNMAKNEKLRAEQEMARINSAAEAAYAKDIPGYRPTTGRMHPSMGAGTSKSAREISKPKDKWANYTSAKDLGIELEPEAQKTSYEIEQEIKGRAARDPGAWETVIIPAEVYQDSGAGENGESTEMGWDGKRKLGEYLVNDDEKAEGEDFKFAHRDKKPVRDPYDEDDWDPKKALGGLKMRKKGESSNEARGQEKVKTEEEIKREKEGALDRAKWTGKLEFSQGGSGVPATSTDKNATEDIKLEDSKDGAPTAIGQDSQVQENELTGDIKPDVIEDIKPNVEGDKPEGTASNWTSVNKASDQTASGDDIKPRLDTTEAEQAVPASNLFKKRRPPPSNRKK